MDESDLPAVGPAPWYLIDEADTRFLQSRKLGHNIIHRIGNMMRPLAPLRHIASNRTVEIGRLNQLDPSGTGPERDGDDVLLRNLMPLAIPKTECTIPRHRLIEISNDNPDMMQLQPI